MITLLPVWLIVGLSGAHLVSQHLADSERQRLAETRLLAKLAAVRLAPSLATSDGESFVLRAREFVAEHPDILQLRILLPDGSEWARFPPEIPVETAGVSTHSPLFQLGSTDLHAARVPGELELRRSPSEIHGHNITNALLLLVSGISITLILSSLASRRITLPFRRLTEAMSQVRRGDLNVRLPEQSPGELRELERGFNSMASDLASASERMHIRIEQATRELQQTMESLEVRNVGLDLARKRAEERSRIKTEFVANMSHEIRTPMNGILGFASLLQKTDLSTAQKEHTDTIVKSATSLMRIVNDILDFSQLESGRLKLAEEPFGLRECIDNVTTLLAPQAYAKGLELIALIYNDVPDRLVGDSIRIGQIITNLLGNAIKFTEQGEVVLRVMLDQESKSKVRLMFRVTDSGIGIPIGEQERLFRAFQQGSIAGKREYGGTGLGLSICRSLAEAMSGTVSVSSREGEGACFRITVVLRLGEPVEKPGPADLRNRRVCLIDANPLSRIALRNAIEQLGPEVQDFEHAQEPGAMKPSDRSDAETADFDLLVVGLPADPVEQARLFTNALVKLRELKLPVLALVSTTEQKRLTELIELGATRSMPKMSKRNRLLEELLCTLQRPRPNTRADVRIATGTPQESDQALRDLLGLVADDNDINLALMQSLLTLHGAKVLTATDGREAVELAIRHPVDLVFMDIHMPRMNGIEALTALRSRSDRYIPVIALTADAAPQNQAAISNAPFDGALTKPLQETQLLSTVSRVLTRLPDRPRIGPGPVSPGVEAEPAAYLPSRDVDQALRVAGGSQQIAEKLFQALLEELPGMLKAIDEAKAGSDWVELWHRVHRLHGSAAVCGVPALKALLSMLEGVVKQRENEEFGELLAQLELEAQRLAGTVTGAHQTH